MTKKQLYAAISSDIDTLQSIYKGKGNRRSEGYTFEELTIGLENFSHFLESYNIKATLFIVGQDLTRQQGVSDIKTMLDSGHEIGNHTMTHAQGFRLLSQEEKTREIQEMDHLAKEKLGIKPIGFRSPGWNISNDVFKLLYENGYHYDSSVFPTYLMPLLKFLHWRTMSNRNRLDRTTMGHLHYMFAKTRPYSIMQTDRSDFIEFPISVMPVLRLPFFATFLVGTGLNLFKFTYRMLRLFNMPVQFMFHLSDFVDYNTPSLSEQVPSENSGQYVPLALRMPLSKKLDLFHRAIDTIAEDYQFITLRDWHGKLTNHKINKDIH